MAIYQTQCTSFKVECFNGIHAFGTTVVRATTDPDTFKLALYTSAASLGADTTVYTTTGEITGTGYIAGGVTLVNVAPVASGTTACVSFNTVTIDPAAFTVRGALIYNATQGNKAVAVLDFGSDITATSTFTITFPTNDSSNAVIRAA